MSGRPLLYILTLLLLTPVPAAQPTPPRLVVESAEADLGEARSGSKLTHTFRLENHGQRLLQIRNIRTSCGCTASDISTREIPSGGYATLTASLDLTGRSGPQHEQIRLQTNDPRSPQKVLTLRANAIPRVRVTPQTLNFQQITAQDPPTGRIVIESTTEAPLEITGIHITNSRVEAELHEEKPGQQFTLSVRPLKTDPPGHYTDQIDIRTDDPEMPSIPVWIMWQIAEAVTVAPRQMNLMLSPSPQPVTRFLLIRGQPDLDPPLEVISVQWEGREIETTVGDSGNFGTRVEIRIIPEAGMDGEHIVIQTNAPGFEQIRLPVRILEP
jgi:hypothetical protein